MLKLKIFFCCIIFSISQIISANIETIFDSSISVKVMTNPFSVKRGWVNASRKMYTNYGVFLFKNKIWELALQQKTSSESKQTTKACVAGEDQEERLMWNWVYIKVKLNTQGDEFSTKIIAIQFSNKYILLQNSMSMPTDNGRTEVRYENIAGHAFEVICKLTPKGEIEITITF